MHPRVVKAAPALLVPAALLWSVDAAGSFPGPLAAVATAAAVALGGWVLLHRGFRFDRLAALAGLLAAWAGVAVVLRPVYVHTGRLLFAGGVIAVALLVLAPFPRWRPWGVAAVTAAGLGASAWLVAEKLLLGGRPEGPAGNPNLAAAQAVAALAVMPLLPGGPLVKAGVTAGLATGILASGSRGALAAAALLGLAWALGRGGRTRSLAAGLAAVALAGVAARVLEDRDPLRWERLRIWAVAVRTVQAELPWGAGPGGFADAALPHNFPREGEFARFHRWPGVAESDILQFAATLGLPGLILAGGLAWAVFRRAGPWTLGTVLALGAASAVNTLLASPAVLWTAALALGATLRRAPPPTPPSPDRGAVPAPATPRGGVGSPRWSWLLAGTGRGSLRWPGPFTAAACTLLAGFLAGAFWPPRVDRFPPHLLEQAAALVQELPGEPSLADAEALAEGAVRRQPRNAQGWQTLGHIRLLRARHHRDARLLTGATAALQEALRHNPNAPFAALAEGQVRRLAGDPDAAYAWVQRSLALEGHFAAAWLELAALHSQDGRLEEACRAVRRARRARALAAGTAMVSDYERALARVDLSVLQHWTALCEDP